MPKINWFERGYCDHPRSDLYPYRDIYSEKDEKDYLQGWWKKSRELEQEKFIAAWEQGL